MTTIFPTQFSLAQCRRSPLARLVELFVCLATLAPAFGQTLIYVNASAAPGGDGQSWATAYQELESALTQAEGLSSGSVEIWVASGTYRPTRQTGATNRTKSFELRASIPMAIIGGFVGVESDPAQRPTPLAITTLSGDLNSDDGPNFTNRLDNAYKILWIATPGTYRIEGFTIRGANLNTATGSDTSVLYPSGAGLYVYSRLPNTAIDAAITDCIFEDNNASSAGAAMFAASREDNNVVTITRVTVDRCTMRLNQHAGTANAVLYWNKIDGSIRNSVISSNLTGGVFVRPPDTLHPILIVNSTVAGNLNWGVFPFTGPIAIANSIIWGNGNGTEANQVIAPGAILDYCTVQGWSGAYPGVQSSGVDPAFMDLDGPDNQLQTPDDDYRLAPSSPAIDSASNSALPPGMTLDNARQNRVADGDRDGLAVVDRGALEKNFPDRIYVNAAGTSQSPDGLAWATAYNGSLGLKQALDNYATQRPVEIWVARGTYTPAPPNGDRSASFNLRNSLTIYGGFLGAESSVLERFATPTSVSEGLNPSRSTILSGDLNSDDSGTLNRADNSFHVVRGDAVGLSAVLDGVTVQGGETLTNNVTIDSYGGGLFLSSASPSVRNSLICRNRSIYGGGLVSLVGSSPLFTGCHFAENFAIPGPSGDSYGAGAVLNSGQPVFRACAFVDNHAIGSQAQGSALHVATGCSPAFLQSTFLRNRSDSQGGVAALSTGADIKFVDCSLLGNTAGNTAGVFASSNTSVSFHSCLIAGNEGVFGTVLSQGTGGIASIIGSTIVGNHTADAGCCSNIAVGAGTTVTIANSLLWGNTWASASGEDAQFRASSGVFSVQQSSIQGWTGATGGVGNTGVDPLFVRMPSRGPDNAWGTPDDDYGDLRLLPTSSAIDSGDSAALPLDTHDIDLDGNITESLPLDLLAFPRFVDDPASPNTGPGAPPHVDRGCFEIQVNCVACPGPREWRSPLGGSWDFPSNWTPSVPIQSHDILFDLDATFIVTLDPPPSGSATRSVRSITVADGGVSLDLNQTTLSSTSLLSQSLVVGTSPSDTTSLSISDGILNVVNAQVAQVPTAPGITHTLTVGPAGRLVGERSLVVGFQGNGRMNIVSGGRVTSRDATIGDQAGSNGFVSVSGPGSTWDIPFFLIIDNGELNVSNSGAVNVGTGIPFTGIFLLNDGRISGDGTINANVVNFGRISPGNSPGSLTIHGGYAQVGEIQDLGAFSGRLDMEIAGSGVGQYDKLVVTGGDVTLGGGMFVTFAPGFQPAPADSFEMLSSGAGAISKQFDVVFFPALTAPAVQSKFLRASYSGLRGPGNGVTVSVADLPVNAGFNPPTSTALTTAPEGAAIGDLDNDADLDIAIALPATSGNGSIALLLNNGSGSFAVTQISSGGVEPRAVAIANLDGVNGNDLAIANAGSDHVRVLRRQAGAPGTANFGDPSPIVIQLPGGSRPIAIAARDLDRPLINDTIDLMTANEGGGGSGTGSVSLVRSSGGTNPYGTSPTSTPVKPGTRPTNIRPFNPNQDKFLDVAVSTSGATGAGAVQIFGNDQSGQGIFNPNLPSVSIAVGDRPSELAAGVLSPGGASASGVPKDEDLVVVNRLSNSVSVLRNTGTFDPSPTVLDPGFAPAVSYPIESVTPGLASDPRSIALSDIDNDGDLDVAVIATNTAQLRVIKVLRNDSTTQTIPGGAVVRQVAFAQTADRTSGDCPRQVLAGDVTGDGRSDLVTINTTCDRGPNLGSVSLNSNTLPPLSQAIGACCAPINAGGTCTLVTQAECSNQLHTFQGTQTLCAPSPCPQPPGACCRGSGCVVLDSVACLSVSQSRYTGPGTACNAPGNLTTPCCKSDFNQNGTVSVQDIFDFLSGWFAGDFMKANFNSDANLSVQDLFDFLAGWFAGCG